LVEAIQSQRCFGFRIGDITTGYARKIPAKCNCHN